MLEILVHSNNKNPISKEQALVLPLSNVGIADIPLVGSKNASVGEMMQQLRRKGVKVPTGFATTAHAYRCFISSTGLEAKLKEIFVNLDVENLTNLKQCGKQARLLMLQTPFPVKLQQAIALAYHKLCQNYGVDTDVAVRSSAIAQDLPDVNFAGQQETFLNVHGLEAVLESCHKCFASIFTDRAIFYRQIKGLDHFNIALSVGVQKMVRADLAAAGVMFSIDTETGFKDAALITAAYGLGENVVQGTVNPDEYLVFKPTLQQGYRPIIKKGLGTKEMKMVYDLEGFKLTKNISVPPNERILFALNDDEILQLANWACIIEEHYSQVYGTYTPMDIEWAKDGLTNELFIIQARKETVQSQKKENVLRSYRLVGEAGEKGCREAGVQGSRGAGEKGGEFLNNFSSSPHPLVTGSSVGETIAQGKARVILDIHQLHQFQSKEVLVTNHIDSNWEPIIKRASAIVTNFGGRTCDGAILARKMGIPVIVGCGNATNILKTGQEITVSCAEGQTGNVYQGLLPYEVQEVALEKLPHTQTQIMLNVSNPEEAFGFTNIPNNGVGLVRMELIIANQIKVHPLALIHFNELEDQLVKYKITELTAQYADKAQLFVDKLAQSVGAIAAAFYPKPVIVRFSDFKNNEYAHLLGGQQFEPTEQNPIIGWRGASRYYDQRYREGFALECQAMKLVRNQMGLTNVILMIPFCRTPQEGRRVLAEMAKHGLVQKENNLQVYVMCELPSNVQLADEFSQIFDGFSIGSNDLTQLTLGIDRNCELVAHLFDEQDEAVQRSIACAIATVKQYGRKIGICGQAASDYLEFVHFLVQQGIDSISLNPDTALKILLEIAAAEQAR
ncbi:phosphoenolpyruvate synthase [Nostoc sp. NIES-4103]|nr:phosphoenolpyruvate synthase [Nostoc sp. NIES-4103]